MSPEQMAEIVEPHATVSDKIRALAAVGVARADIARFLGKRYQHVRNVLVADAAARPTPSSAEFVGVREEGRAFDLGDAPGAEWRGGGLFRLVAQADGSITLPATVREALRVAGGGVVMGQLNEEGFVLISAEASARKAQAMVRKLTPGPSIVDELIADRRREAEREESDG